MTEFENLSNAEIEEMGIDPDSLTDEQGRGPCCADPLCGCRHYG